jgi:hypothetical protein
VRIIEVPHEEHCRLEYSDRLPLYQMIGKNVGIRRARGEYVVATNIDILFSDELMRFIASRRLQHGFVYRVDRVDVPAELDGAWPMAQQLAFCAASAIRINRREGTLDYRDGTFYRIYPYFSLGSWLRNAPRGRRLAESRVGRLLGIYALVHRRLVPHSGFGGWLQDASRFGLRHIAIATRSAIFVLRFVWHRVYAFVYWIVAGFNSPRLVPRRIRKLLVRLAASAPRGSLAAEADAGAARVGRGSRLRLPIAVVRGIGVLAMRKRESLALAWAVERARVPLHTNASGDFTLMSREDWFTTRGYAELQMYSMHIDGLHLYVSHYLGIRERFLPFPVFHIEHGGGFRPEAKGEESLDATLARRAIPQITNAELLAYIEDMYRTRRPTPFNAGNWGLADAELPEARPAGWKDEPAGSPAYAQGDG